jgi:hypothetical protein
MRFRSRSRSREHETCWMAPYNLWGVRMWSGGVQRAQQHRAVSQPVRRTERFEEGDGCLAGLCCAPTVSVSACGPFGAPHELPHRWKGVAGHAAPAMSGRKKRNGRPCNGLWFPPCNCPQRCARAVPSARRAHWARPCPVCRPGNGLTRCWSGLLATLTQRWVRACAPGKCCAWPG